MLKAIGWLIKLALFSTLVLVLGNWIQWDGRTISDQVRTRMAHAEKSEIVQQVKGWTGQASRSAERASRQVARDARKGAVKARQLAEDSEELATSERQKLKALIRELNSPAKEDSGL